MPNKMLIDASHREETRVVVVRGSRIEEFDFESQDKKQLKGNIYLARVTRVEPSLQAAFVEYGGNRHGFLAFSEIHPDYYQIPVADRQALLRAEAAEAEEDNDEGDDDPQGRGNRRRRRAGRGRGVEAAKQVDEQPADASADATPDEADALTPAAELTADRADAPGDQTSAAESASDSEILSQRSLPGDETLAEGSEGDRDSVGGGEGGGGASMPAAVDGDVISERVAESSLSDTDRGLMQEVASHEESEVESVGAEDALEEVRSRRKPVRRHYKIQEVIKRRQILLVQVVKEERGNKGAALTTYLSLAGRYSVLMPNTARGGGISRKITNLQDRKRLKDVVADLDVPQGMGVILRTAGESRTKAEIKRDYEYLMRLWENVRSLTLRSTAPALVYEEGSLIKRSVRDLYNKDIDEVLVAGEDGYREAKDFMRMLMPSHAKVVQPYRDTTPVFVRFGVEAQLDRMLQPQVTLKSGGYIIINQTEALVSIDVNSGRSTREHSIEETALHTNLEAAEEVARQLRLRDLAGLIVIDFIDMEENRNNRAVEKRLKDHLKNDRARIQVGRISHFGLMEMSRQRIRASVLESTTKPCPHCGGTGHVRSDSSVALLVMRAIEEYLLKDSRSHITVSTPASTALYVLNHKRSNLSELEHRFGLRITVAVDDSVGSQHYAIVRGDIVERASPVAEVQPAAPFIEPLQSEDAVPESELEEAAVSDAQSPQHGAESDEEGGRDRKRRRRRRRRGRDRENGAVVDAAASADSQDLDDGEEPGKAEEDTGSAEASVEPGAKEAEDGDDGKKRRRGKRGGKRHRRDEEQAGADIQAEPADERGEIGVEASQDLAAVAEADRDVEPADAAEQAAADGIPDRASDGAAMLQRLVPAELEPAAVPREGIPTPDSAADGSPQHQDGEEPVASRATRRKPGAPVASDPVVAILSGDLPEAGEEKPKKAGWWQRRSFF